MTIKQQGGIFGRNPTFNDVDVDGSLNVNNDNLYVDSNTVGIGTNNPVSLIAGGDGPILSIGGTDNILTNDEKTGTISFITSDGSYKGTYSDGIAAEIACITETATGAGYGLAFYTGVTTASNRAERLRISRTGDVELKTGNLIVPSGNGIDFSATSGTGTSELFDDYEEGLWSPTVDSGTCYVSYGSYIKIGKMVHATFKISDLSDTTTASAINVSLPFTAGSFSSSEWLGSWLIRRYDVSTSVAGVMRVLGGGTTMDFRYSDSTVGSDPKSVNYDDNTSGTNDYLAGSITYFSAS